ncbi:MAG TPA: inositol monophosphatase family protein [Acidimicrobiales bacterium]|nr:inositol monophosphatase family protein [Acidimicrobiales bacterium]
MPTPTSGQPAVAAASLPESPALNPDLELALTLADQADAMTLARFRASDLVVESKPDLSPVTEADRDVEATLRRRLAEERPDHAVLGEEMGETSGTGVPWRWVIDPIDGTKNYVRGIPVWGTLIALQHEGETAVGVVSAPALGRRWWAARGEGAFLDGDRLQVSGVADLGDACVSYDDLPSFDRLGLADALLALGRRVWRMRDFSDFWAHMLVAEGAIDAAVYAEPAVNLWDLAPLKVIVEEAGGRFTDLAGTATDDGDSAVSSNGLLHDEVLAAFR